MHAEHSVLLTSVSLVALRNIAKIEKPEIVVLFENEASYEDSFCSSHVTDTLCNIFT